MTEMEKQDQKEFEAYISSLKKVCGVEEEKGKSLQKNKLALQR